MAAIASYHAKGIKVELHKKSVVFNRGPLYFNRDANRADALAILNTYSDGYDAGFKDAQNAMLRALGLEPEGNHG